MNKIYKVMYSKVKQCAVVVSEIAKSHGHNGESSSVRKHAALMAAVLIALGSLSIEGMPVAQADANAHNNDFIGANDYYWYWDQKDNKWEQNTYRDLMVGHLPRKDLPNNEGAGAKETGSIAAGLYAQAGMQTVTIGNRNAGQSRGSVFIGEHSGYDDKAGNTPKGSRNNYVTSVGFQSDATGWGSIAIGSNATAKNTKKTDVAVTMTGNTDEDKKNGIYEIEKNPMIEGASVALGYSAQAQNGNIAIGAYSEATTDLSADKSDEAKSYLTKKTATSYVSVGKKGVQRRISNVADGAAATDVATVGQLQELSKELGGYKAGFGIKIDPDSTDTTKNTISLKRNLGTNYGNEYKGKGNVTFEADGENALILGGGAINDSSYEADKDFTYGAHAKDSVLVGGMNNDIEKNSERALIVGGTNNKIFSTGEVQQTGTDAIIVGGSGNKAEGDNSLLIGGVQNEASGLKSTIIGGLENKNEGWDASIWGGYYNQITGVSQASGILGGDNNKIVNGGFSYILGGENNTADGGLTVIIGGGYNKSSGLYSSVFGGANNLSNANASTVVGGQLNGAIGAGSVVSGGGANLASGGFSYASGGRYNHVTGDLSSSLGGMNSSVNGMYSTGVAGGSTGKDAMLSLAAGYQSVVADSGIEKTDLSEDNPEDADELNKYSEALEAYGEGDKSKMESLSGYYEPDPDSSMGHAKVTHYDKFSTALGYQATADEPGTIAFGHDAGDESGYTYEWETLTDEKGNPKQNEIDGTTNDYTKAPKSVKKKAPYTSAYYNRLVKIADGKDAHDAVTVEQLNKVQNDLDTSKTHFYNVNSKDTEAGNYNNDGAKGAGSMAAGFSTHADGIASTVTGSYSGVINSGTAQGLDLRGAAALSYGTVNVNQNTDPTKAYSGVANSIVGQANMTTNSNAAIIYGAGNTVTDSYRPIDQEKAKAILGSTSDPKALSKAMQDAVKDSGGQVMVMGGGNVVDNAYMSQVTGVGNTVRGNQVYAKNAKTGKWEWTTDTNKDTAIKGYDKDKSSQYNYVDGFNNEVINGKHDYIIGANNTLTGDSYDDNSVKPIKKSNQSNIVIGDNHTLDRKKNTVIIGSSDTANTVTNGSDAVIIGHNANAASDTGADNAVAIGLSAKAAGGNAVSIGANTSAGADSITIGSVASAVSGSNIAIGRYARVYGNKVTNAVALGQNANALVADGVAIGSGSKATVAASVEGYDPVTGKDSTDATATWKATNAAVSIGTADGTVTRQINGLAAGTNDTDAVNVAQLKKLEGMKANVDATNIGKNLKGADGNTASAEDITANEKAWGAALGTGDIATPKDMLVTDKAIHDELRPTTDGTYVKGSQTTAENLSKLDAQVKTNADGISTNTTNITKNAGDITNLKNLSNITDEGRTVIKNLSKDAVKVEAGDRVTVTSTDNKETGTITYKVSANNNGTVTAGDQNLVSGDTVNTAINNAITNAGTATDTKLAGKANVDATNIGKNLKGAGGNTASAEDITANEKAWGAALGTGDIATPKDMLVTDKAIHDELRPTTDGTYVKGSQTTAENLSKLDAQVKTNADGISTNTTNITKNAGDITNLKNLSNITDEGRTVIKNLSKDAVKVEAGDRVTVTSTDNKETGTITYKVSANNNGTVTAGDQNLVSGDTVNTAINNAITNAGTATDTKLAGKANVDATNIGKNLKGADGNTASAEDITANEKAWGAALGTGDIATPKDMLVTDKAIHDELRPTTDGTYVKGSQTTAENLSKLDAQVKTNADGISTNTTNITKNAGDITNLKNLSNITDEGRTVIKNLSKDAVKVEAGDRVTVTSTDNKETGTITYKVSANNNGTVTAGDQNLVSGDTVNTAINNAITNAGTATDTKLAGKANVDATNIGKNLKGADGKTASTEEITANENAWGTAIGTGEIAKDNGQLVTGKTVYAYNTPVAEAGKNLNYVSADKTTGQNLSALDTNLKTTSDLIHTNTAGDTIQIGESSSASKIDVHGKDSKGRVIGRVITGVVADDGDPTSAANVGYVNGVTAANTQQIYRDMNNAYGRLNNNINKAAAGSNALAALHPLDYDPDDKADFAVGYGHYRNANAAAVGAFYHPNENTMVNVGVSLGNGDPGFNAGVSFKIGSGSAGHQAMSKTEMAKVINSQSKEIDALKKDNADKDKRIDALEQKMAEILAKLDKNGK